MKALKALPLKKYLPFIAVGAIILLLVGISFFNAYAITSSVQEALRKDRRVITSLMETKVAHVDTATPSEEKTVILKDFNTVTDKLNCSFKRAAWQITPVHFTVQSDCLSFNQKVASLKAEIISLRQTVVYDTAVDTLLKNTITTDQDNALSIEQHSDNWKKLLNDLQKITPPQIATAFTEEFLVGVKKIQASWQTLVEADKAQNKANYDTALANLQNAYSGLPPTANKMDEIFARQQYKMMQAYKKLIND